MYVEICVSVCIYAYTQFISQWKKKKQTQTVVVKEMQSTNFLFILLDK